MAPPTAQVTTTRTKDTTSSSNRNSHQKQPQTQSQQQPQHPPKPPTFEEDGEMLDFNQVQHLTDYLGKCDPNDPVQFMKFVDRAQELSRVDFHSHMCKFVLLECTQNEAYHWYVSVKSNIDDLSQFLKALQKKFKDMVLAAATRDMALLEPESLSPPHIRAFLEQFYALADVIEHFNKGTNVYGLLYKRLYKHEQIKKHLMGAGRESDLLTNCMDIKAITLREEYAENSDLIQRAMSTSSKNCNHNHNGNGSAASSL